MRLNINLASQPYQDVRRFLVRWGVPTLVLAVCTVGLVWYTVHSWRRASDINQQIGKLEQEMQQLQKQHDDAVALLNRPENRSTVETSQFLNAVIAHKAFSWTQVFMQLEQIMPPRIHVVSMKPVLGKDGRLQLEMQVAGDSRDKAVELVQRLEGSKAFRAPVLKSEGILDPAQAGGDTVQFEITADYVPQVNTPAKMTSTTASASPSEAGAQTVNEDSTMARGGKR
jgi:type IV pilus assembly protein PilN